MTIKLVQTCGACPEQYDAYQNSEQVGYLRLRHGHFRVECPDVGGEEVYHAEPFGDGCFECDERDRYLSAAAAAIQAWIARRSGTGAPLYEIVDRIVI